MAENDCLQQPAQTVLPQIVIADFRLNEMPADIRLIIEKSACQTKGLDWVLLEDQLRAIENGSEEANKILSTYLQSYLTGRDWPLPTYQEFAKVHAFNELLAWVLIFGRRPNHFTFSIHLLELFTDFESFNAFI